MYATLRRTVNADDIRLLFSPWRERHGRPAWKPRVGGAAAPFSSRFGGSPILAAGEAWPACGSCGDPMQFFLQLALTHCPTSFGAREGGLLQMFYCSRDDGSCETWSAFSGTHLVRILDVPGALAPHPAGLAPFPERAVLGWEALTDYPAPEDHRALGVAYDYDFKNKRVSARCAELGLQLLDVDIDLDVAEAIATSEAGDKLGGWPAWVQGVEYPSCTECGQTMRLVLQVDSEDNVPFMFGDVGCGHITQCPAHPSVLTFAWACG